MDSLTGLFCLIGDFCREFEPAWERRLLADGAKKRRRPCGLSLSELMTLMVLSTGSASASSSAFTCTTPAATWAANSPSCPATTAASSCCRAAPSPSPPCSRRSRASATASPSWTPRPWPSATTAASPATASSRGWPHAARPPWAGFSASSCTSSSTRTAGC